MNIICLCNDGVVGDEKDNMFKYNLFELRDTYNIPKYYFSRPNIKFHKIFRSKKVSFKNIICTY